MLFDSTAPDVYADSLNNKILMRMERSYKEHLPLQQDWWLQADIDSRFRAGDQTLWNEILSNIPVSRRRQFNFNHIRRIINMMTGHQRRNRKSLAISPYEGYDPGTAKQQTEVLRWSLNQADAYELISDAFDSGLVTGMSLIAIALDYTKDPRSGDLSLELVPWNGYIIDTFFKKKDLSDCNFIWRRKWVSREQSISLFPDKADEILNWQFRSNRDQKFTFLPENLNLSVTRLLPLDEYWYLDHREAVFIIDSETEETFEWRGEKDDLKEFLKQTGFTTYKRTVPTVKLALVLGGKVMYDGANPYGIDTYPFVGFFGYIEPQLPYYSWKIQGVVRGLRDAQFLYNRRKQIELDILESTAASGYFVKEGTLVDDSQAFTTGNGRGIFIKKDGKMEDIREIRPPSIDQSAFLVTEGLSNEMNIISGANEELLGAAEDDLAGITSMLRQGAALTTIQPLFDQLDNSQRRLGEVIFSMIQSNWSVGKVGKILNAEPSERFFDRNFSKYQMVVENALMTQTQQMLEFAQLWQLKVAGMDVPAHILFENAPLQSKEELMQWMQQQEQQQAQVAQVAQQMQMQQMQLEAEAVHAKSESDKSLAAERFNKITLDAAISAERIARADEDREAATLDRLKSVKELQDIDISHLERFLNIAQGLNDKKEEEAEKIKQEVSNG